MNTTIPRIVVVGAITVDDCYVVLSDEANKAFDCKVTAESNEYRLGGGAGNCAQALEKFSGIFEQDVSIRLITRIGKPPEGNRKAKEALEIALDLLHANGIDYTDVTQGENVISKNIVTEDSKKGRQIIKMPETPHQAMKGDYVETIEASISTSAFVFVDPKKHRMGQVAAIAARKHNKICMTDWGQSTWPSDPEKAQAIRTILRNADIVAVPAEAVVEYIDDKGEPQITKDADELFAALRDYYNVPNILLSDGSEPVRVLVNGEESSIDVVPHSGSLFANAAGDTRNASVLWALSQNFSMLDAFKFGTAAASVKIKYPGMQWVKDFKEDILKHPSLPHSVGEYLNKAQTQFEPPEFNH